MDGDITVACTLMTHRDREEGGDVLVRLGSLSVSLVLGILCITAAHGWMDALHWVMAWGGVSCIYDGLHGYVNLSPHSPTLSSCYLVLSHGNTRTPSDPVVDMTHLCQSVLFPLNLVSHCD
jgi:hypothetical protein